MKSSTKIAASGPAALALALALAGCGGSGGGMQAQDNSAPTISTIGSQSTDQDTPLALNFSVADRESSVSSLMVTAAADGTAVFPADGVVLSGDGAMRTLTLTPLESTAGPATITLNVIDPQGASSSRSFQVAVKVRDASLRAMALDTFAKGEGDEPTIVNGWTMQNDVDDPQVFAALLGGE